MIPDYSKQWTLSGYLLIVALFSGLKSLVMTVVKILLGKVCCNTVNHAEHPQFQLHFFQVIKRFRINCDVATLDNQQHLGMSMMLAKKRRHSLLSSVRL